MPGNEHFPAMPSYYYELWKCPQFDIAEFEDCFWRDIEIYNDENPGFVDQFWPRILLCIFMPDEGAIAHHNVVIRHRRQAAARADDDAAEEEG